MSNDSKKILHIIDHLNIGGAQTLLVNCLLFKSKNASKLNHKVIVLHGNQSEENYLRLKLNQIEVVFLTRSKLNFIEILLKLFYIILKERYDILHLHLRISSLIGGFFSLFKLRIKVISTCYETRTQFPKHFPIVFRIISFFCHGMIDLFEGGLVSIGIDKKKVFFIPMAISYENANPERHDEIRAELALAYSFKKTSPLLLSIARLNSDRQISKLIEGFIEVVMECPDVILVMVGDGPEKDNLIDLSKQAGVYENIRFVGTRTDVWNIHPGCDIYLSGAENCQIGISGYEAMACARPTVAYSTITADKENKRCDKRGLFIESFNKTTFASAIVNLIRNPSVAKEMGMKARENILNKASIETFFNLNLEVYNAIKK